MRSVVVVLPASMWAMMPMLRVLSSGADRGIAFSRGAQASSPAVVGEGLVRLRHLVRVLALLHRLAALVGRVDQLVRELVAHALALARARRGDDPAHREGGGALGPDLDRHLIGGAAHAARLHLDARPHVLDRAAEHGHGVVSRLVLDLVEGAVEDPLGGTLLAVAHHGVHETADHAVAVLRIGRELTLVDLVTSGHGVLSKRRRRAGGRAPPERLGSVGAGL